MISPNTVQKKKKKIISIKNLIKSETFKIFLSNVNLFISRGGDHRGSKKYHGTKLPLFLELVKC